LVLAVAAAVGLVALVISINRESPDRTVAGTVTEVQAHRLCVAGGDGVVVCVRAVSPERIASTAPGDCVRVRYSSDEVLISLDPTTGGC